MLFGILILQGLALLGQADVSAQLEAANEAYLNKDYAAAADQYEALRAQGYESVALYHNLGHAYFRQEAWARAVLHYRRGLRLAPQHKGLWASLRAAQERTEAVHVEIAQSATVLLWRAVQGSMRTHAWAWLSLALLWLAAIGLGLWQFGRQRSMRKRGFIVGVFALGLCLLASVFAYGRAQQEYYREEAVVMVDVSSLHIAPEADSKEVQQVYAGELLLVLDQLGGWYKVRLSDTTEGWLPQDLVTKV